MTVTIVAAGAVVGAGHQQASVKVGSVVAHRELFIVQGLVNLRFELCNVLCRKAAPVAIRYDVIAQNSEVVQVSDVVVHGLPAVSRNLRLVADQQHVCRCRVISSGVVKKTGDVVLDGSSGGSSSGGVSNFYNETFAPFPVDKFVQLPIEHIVGDDEHLHGAGGDGISKLGALYRVDELGGTTEYGTAVFESDIVTSTYLLIYPL